jgi:hypothetical protein
MEWEWLVESLNTRNETCPSAILSSIHPDWNGLGLNPCPSVQRPPANDRFPGTRQKWQVREKYISKIDGQIFGFRVRGWHQLPVSAANHISLQIKLSAGIPLCQLSKTFVLFFYQVHFPVNLHFFLRQWSDNEKGKENSRVIDMGCKVKLKWNRVKND